AHGSRRGRGALRSDLQGAPPERVRAGGGAVAAPGARDHVLGRVQGQAAQAHMTGDGKLCRALGTHSWKLVGPVLVLAGETRRVTLHCERCKTWRYDLWSRRTGGLAGAHLYQRADDYQAYLKDHKRDGARLDIMAGTKEISNASEHPRLRLLHGRPSGGKGRAARHRRSA